MATVVRPEVSEKNKYWVNKHRYYELKHFCLQYPYWKRSYEDIEKLILSHTKTDALFRTDEPGDPTYKLVEERLFYFCKMDLLKQMAEEADPDLADYILRAVTEELSYEYLRTRLGIPCSRDTYYNRYRKFFWLLDKARN